MLIPSGSLWITSTVAPGRREDLRPDDAAGPVRAVEDDPQARRPSIDAGEPEAVLAIALEQRRIDDRPADLGVADRAELLGPPDQLLDLVLDRVVELEAVPRRGP